MAVNIDKVYQKVLAIANKEQRGYITPQEFNLFADQAQIEIFEQYFYDIDQFERRVSDEVAKFIKSKIEFFKVGSRQITHNSTIPYNAYFIDSVFLSQTDSAYASRNVPVEKLDRDNNLNIHTAISSSRLLRPNNTRPVYWIVGTKIRFDPQYGDYRINFVRTPQRPNWTYVVDSTTQNALYNPSSPDKKHFELHRSEENKLVVKILQLAGIAMKDFGLAQLAGQKEANTIQQEKQ